MHFNIDLWGRALANALAIATISLSATGCAVNPDKLCASLVPPSWTRVDPPPDATTALTAYLPRTPYTTNTGHIVQSARTLWYRQSDELIACTLEKHATDNCSVHTTQFALRAGTWLKVADDAVLCNVTLTHAGS